MMYKMFINVTLRTTNWLRRERERKKEKRLGRNNINRTVRARVRCIDRRARID